MRPEPGTAIRARELLAAAALMMALALFAYWPALGGGFVFDDDAMVANNELVKASDGLFRIWFTTEPLDYWPVTNTSFWLEWRLWGTHAAGYHATNLLLHVCSGLLLWGVLRRLAVPGAFLAALLFIVHPVNVESVAWIAQRKNCLSMVFLLLATLWYLNDRWRLSLAAFAIAMLSKGSVAVLPGLLALLIWWQRGGLRRQDLVRLAPFAVVAIVLTLVNIWFQQHYMAGQQIRDVTLLQRALGAGAVVWFYLYKAVLPLTLMFVYPQWTIRAGDVRWWLPLAAAIAATLVLWRLRDRRFDRPLFGFWIFFVVALIPVMGLTDVYFMKYSLVADHYQHIALVGVVTIAGAALAIVSRQPAIRSATGAAVIIVLALLAWQQSRQYVSAEALYRSTLDRNPAAWMAHSNLGLLLLDDPRGDVNEALGHFQRALELNPAEPKLQNNVGVALFRLARYREAADRHRAAIGLSPTYAEAYANLGADLQRLGQHHEAADAYREALRLNPRLAIVHQGLVVEMLALGEFDAALSELRAAEAAAVDDAEGHGAMGDALLQKGRVPEAIAEYRRALQLDPESERLLTNLGYALTAAGQREEAERHLRRAVQLNPRDAIAHDYLGNLLLDSGRLPEAVDEFNVALQMASPADLPAIHNDLAIALGQADRINEAIAHLREALRLKPDFAPARENLARALTRK